MRADIHGGPEQKLQSEAGYIDARPQTDSSTKTSCNARPDHTFGSKCHMTQRPRHVLLAPITDSVSTMRWSYLPAAKEQPLAPPNRPRLAENKRSGSALRSQCRRGDDVVAGTPDQQRPGAAVCPSRP